MSITAGDFCESVAISQKSPAEVERILSLLSLFDVKNVEHIQIWFDLFEVVVG
jgi:hypothetical protein